MSRLILPRRDLIVPSRHRQRGFFYCNPFAHGSGGPAVTWNPSDKAANIVLSGGDLIAGRTGTNTYQSVRATLARSLGFRYFEVLVGGSTSASMMVGVATTSSSLSNFVGGTLVANSGWGWNATNGGTYTNNTLNSASATTFAVGDVLMIAYDATNGRLYFGKNGTWAFGGNPAAGTGHRYSTPVGAVLYPMCSIFEGATGQTWTGKFASSDFVYSPPSGFSAWQ